MFGEIRAIEIDGEPWFLARDVAEKLGYSQTQAMVKLLNEDEYIVVISSTLDGIKGVCNNKVTLISEFGLYHAVICSHQPKAKEFRKWITDEVIPSIRKTGAYSIEEQFQIPKTYPEALRMTADLHEKLEGVNKGPDAKNGGRI